MTADDVMRVLLPLLVRFEGVKLRPYLCSAGVPTIGIGSTRYLDGRPVRMTDPAITLDDAYALCIAQTRADYLPAVMALCHGLDTAQRVAAITSWCYNLGSGALRASTMRKRINERAWRAARAECLKWDKAAGKRVRGLTIRRQVEAALI